MTDDEMLKFIDFRIAELTPPPGEHVDRLKVGMIVALREMAGMLNGVAPPSALTGKDGSAAS